MDHWLGKIQCKVKKTYIKLITIKGYQILTYKFFLIIGLGTPVLLLLSNLTFHDDVMASWQLSWCLSSFLIGCSHSETPSTTHETQLKSLLLLSLFAGCLWRQLSTKHQSWLHYWWHHLCVFKTGAVPCLRLWKRRWFCRNLCKARIKCRPGDLCFLLRLYWDFTKLHFLKMKKNLLFEGILLSLIGLKPTKVHIQSQANKHRSAAFRNQAKESGTLAGAIWRGKTHRSRDSWLVTTVCLLCLVEACYTSSFWTNQSSFTITSSWEEKENKQT